jgi:multidrug efflux pump subunit AcrB
MVNSLIEKISHFFADNKPLSILILISIVLFGVMSFILMPKQYNPEIIRPAFVINFSYEGATPKEAVDRVGYELVEKLNVVPGIDDILTRVSDGAQISSTVIFEVGYDKAQAKVDLMSQINSHSYLSSGAVGPVTIEEINPETIPVLQVVFSSPTLALSEVREKVLALKNEIVSVPGVSEVSVAGGDNRAVMIEVDPVKLDAALVSLAAINNVLASTEVRVVSSGFEGEKYSVSTSYDARVSSVEEIGLLPLGGGVRLRDVALVYEGISTDRAYTLFADKDNASAEVVMLALAKQEGTSAPVVTGEALKNLNEILQRPDYQELTFKVVSDDGAVASQEILGLTTNLITSIGIVTLVLLLFLSTRAALVVLVTIPLTFLTVLSIGLLFGESINRITLFALILSLGLLVDASIVVVDNIYTHIKNAHEHGRAVSMAKVAAGAVSEVGVGLVLSAVTSVIVFLPLIYITGMMGPYMGPLAFFVPAALLVSLVVAIVLVPFISVHTLKGDESENKLGMFFKNILERVTQKYISVLKSIAYKAAVRKKLLWSSLGVFVLSLVLPMTGLVHFQMLPKADRDQFYLYVDAPAGTASEATKEFTEDVVTRVLKNGEVVSAQMFVAGAPIVDFNGLFKGAPMRTEYDQATVRINLTSAKDRSLSSTDITTEVRQMLRDEIGDRADFVRLMEEPPGPPVAATLVAKVSSGNLAAQKQVAAEVFGLFKQVDGVVDVYESADAPVEEINYKLDREKVSAAGADGAEVGRWFSLLGGNSLVSEYQAADSAERIPMYVTLPYEYRMNPNGGATLPVSTTNAGLVPLTNLLTTTYVPKTSAIYMEAAESTEYVTAEVQGRSIVYVVIELMHRIIKGDLENYSVTQWGLFGMTLSDGSESVSLDWGGEWEMTLENFRDLGIAMLVALFMVYGVLVAQYRSFSTPGFILVTIPLGLVGILFGFTVLDIGFGIYLTATALIGFIALIGIVVNNAIIFLEYVDQAEAEGTPFAEALIAAGAVRLRPILLTSLTTVLGSLTIASDPVWSGLAWAIIFGLSLSTVLTLIILPALLLQFSHKNK